MQPLILAVNCYLSLYSLLSILSKETVYALHSHRLPRGSEFSDRRGPTFIYEPPNRVDFSNTTGTVIPCSAHGLPSPVIKWEAESGQSITDVPGLRRVRPDGSLVFPPFRPEDYRPDIHSATYKCIAGNSLGVIASRNVHVRGVVKQSFVVEVYDEFIVSGNTAVFKCHVPGFVKDYLTISAWLEEPSGRVIQPTGTIMSSHQESGAGALGRYLVLQSGELYIRNVDASFSHRTYKCRARHRLTGETFTSSSSGKLIVTESHNVVSPRISDIKSRITGIEGENVALPCAAQSYPLPTYRWYKKEGHERILLSTLNDRLNLLDGTLILQDVKTHDSGVYVCLVNNSIGEERGETELVVRAPLSVKMVPQRQSVDVGKSALLNCSVSGHPITSIVWEKDHKRVKPGGYGGNSDIRLLSKDLIHIDSVQKDHRGMYQCFVFNDYESVAATSELTLGDDPPEFRETFKSQTLDPGPPLSLKCAAAGNPLPQITWSLDEAPIPESLRVRFGDYVTKESMVISYVNISDVRVEDGGEYKCTSDNGVALIEHMARINVVGPPVVRPMRNLTVVAGEVLIVRCPVAGHPLDSIAWERGLRLPYNHRQKVHDNGTLEVHHVERATDEGPYTCIARNKKGQQAQSTVYISVKIKPVIEPFLFPKSLREGQRATVLCTVSSGDLPIQLRWFKDNVPIVLNSNKGVRVNEVSGYSSTLMFESLTLDHKGNYTCIATNDAGTVSHAATMVIHVPPRWVIEPADSSVVRGRGLSVDCQAEGFPVPRIRWTKAEGNAPRDFKPIVSSPHLQVYENGSLTVHDARDGDAGYYLCQASNGISSGLSKVLKITVHVAAHFKSKFTAEMVRKGHNIRLKCEAFGDKPIAISWTKDKQKIDSHSGVATDAGIGTDFAVGSSYPQAQAPASDHSVNVNVRYEFIETVSTKGIVSEIQIKRADRRDSALFTCLASNAFGYDDTNIQLIVQEPPDPPQDLQVVEIASRSIKLAWSPPYSGNSPITNYFIQYRNAAESSKWFSPINVSIPSGESFGQVTGLKPATLYYLRLVAENRIGKSEPGRTVEAVSDEEAPGSPPTKVQVVPLSSKSAKVTWKPPIKEQQHGIIRGYYIGYKEKGATDPFIYKTLEVQDVFKEETIVTGLRRFSQYTIVVQAFNNKGAGPSSEEITVKSLEMDPPVTPQLHVTSTSSSSIHLAWEPVNEDGNPIDGYFLQQRQESSTEWREIRLQGHQTFYAALSLKCGTRYQFYLVAYNKIGRGEQSDVATVKSDGSVPVAPDKQSVVSVNTSSAVIHLDAWHHGGCPIKSFKVRYRLQGSDSDWTEKFNPNLEKQVELHSLAPAKKYQLQITASNDVGFTEAVYSFSTLSLIPDELGVRSSTKYIRGGQRAVSQLSDYSIVIPVTISILVILILLVVVCLVVKKNSGAGTSSLYSAVSGRKGQESLQMTTLSNKSRSAYMASSYDSGCATGTSRETTPKVNGDCVTHGHMETEPLYATVKRTPRPPRTDGAHIYSYPIPVTASQVESFLSDSNTLPSTSIKTPTATLIVNVDERDLETKLLELAPCGTHMRRYSLGQT